MIITLSVSHVNVATVLHNFAEWSV